MKIKKLRRRTHRDVRISLVSLFLPAPREGKWGVGGCLICEEKIVQSHSIS